MFGIRMVDLSWHRSQFWDKLVRIYTVYKKILADFYAESYIIRHINLTFYIDS